MTAPRQGSTTLLGAEGARELIAFLTASGPVRTPSGGTAVIERAVQEGGPVHRLRLRRPDAPRPATEPAPRTNAEQAPRPTTEPAPRPTPDPNRPTPDHRPAPRPPPDPPGRTARTGARRAGTPGRTPSPRPACPPARPRGPSRARRRTRATALPARHRRADRPSHHPGRTRTAPRQHRADTAPGRERRDRRPACAAPACARPGRSVAGGSARRALRAAAPTARRGVPYGQGLRRTARPARVVRRRRPRRHRRVPCAASLHRSVHRVRQEPGARMARLLGGGRGPRRHRAVGGRDGRRRRDPGRTDAARRLVRGRDPAPVAGRPGAGSRPGFRRADRVHRRRGGRRARYRRRAAHRPGAPRPAPAPCHRLHPARLGDVGGCPADPQGLHPRAQHRAGPAHREGGERRLRPAVRRRRGAGQSARPGGHLRSGQGLVPRLRSP